MSLQVWKVASQHRATEARPIIALGLALVVFGASAILTLQFSPSAAASPTGSMVVTLTSPNAIYHGDFGDSVAGSGTTVVVGADRETANGKSEAGHAYLFNASSGALISTLTSPNARVDGYFGVSVAVSGTTVVVGATGETVKGDFRSGHAYLFNASTGALIKTLTSPNAPSGGGFGASVAVSGGTAVVGASGETASGEYDAGHAYEFNAKTGALIRTLSSPNAQGSGLFGGAVAVSGRTVVVGAYGETANRLSDAGHAYLFNASTGALISILTSPNAREFGSFGYSVAVSGTTVVVGALSENASGQTAAGDAYEFNAETGALIKTLSSPNAQEGGSFGVSVAVSGTNLVVGAYGESVEGHSDAGHAYEFNAQTGALISTLTSLNTLSTGYFGYSVAISGKTVVVGAFGETANGLRDAGHAYIF